MLLRYDKQLTRRDVSHLTEIKEPSLEAIEVGRGAILRFYIEYATFLGVPLSQIFINALERKEEDLRIQLMPGKFYLTSEEWVMERVQEAVRHLENSGQRLTLKAISAATGFSKTGLYKYVRVKTFIREMLYRRPSPSRTQDPLYEDELLEKARRAIQELTQAGKPITHRVVCSLIGISARDIVRYPQVKMFLGHFVDYALQQQKHHAECEQSLLEKVRFGVMDLEEHQQPVTYNSIGQKIGIHEQTWLRYPQVRAFVEQHIDSPFLHAKKEREQQEESLVPRVEEALGKLELAGEPVTFQRVGKLLGITPYVLKSSPRVNELIELRKSPRFRERPSRRGEEEVFSEVQRVISWLTERNMSVNYKAIAREMGSISDKTLQTYPKVRRLVDEHLQSYHRYHLQEFALREEQLLCRMEAAITELEALNKPVTQRELCKMVGRDLTTLRLYPRVKALLEQKTARHLLFQQLRTPLEEEELMKRVKEAIVFLSDHGENITTDRVALKVKISRTVLLQYPQVVVFLEQHGYQKRKSKSEREEELLNLVDDAIKICKAGGQPITKKRVSDMVGVNRSVLNSYAEVRTLLTQVATEDQQQHQEHRFQAREDELTQQVVATLQEFQDTNKRISKCAIDKAVGISKLCSRYPRIKALVESAIQAQNFAKKTPVS